MAELNTGDDSGKGGKVRSKKSNSKVDLTAMVDLAFLLITFFMLTTSLSKPQSMDLALPDKNDKPEIKEKKTLVDENRTMTIMLGENGKLKWYMGFVDKPLAGPKDVVYGKEGIRKAIIERKKVVLDYSTAKGKPTEGIIVIIKPGKKSTYRNLVDILDEMAINKVETYAIVDEFTPEETKVLEGK